VTGTVVTIPRRGATLVDENTDVRTPGSVAAEPPPLVVVIVVVVIEAILPTVLSPVVVVLDVFRMGRPVQRFFRLIKLDNLVLVDDVRVGVSFVKGTLSVVETVHFEQTEEE
jgi:hypothetical protein